MTLPELPFKIPEIPLPFDIPALMHPPVAHFIIALPVIVLLLEIVNLIVKKRAIGATSFFLLLLTLVVAVAAYYTGGVDGKAAWDILTQDGQTAVKAHKLFGTYLLLASVIVLLFKLLSALVQRGLMKAVYLVVLIFFVAGILKQGKEGGELVYTHGANVKIVKTMDDKMFEIQDELNDYIAEEKEAEEEAAQAAKAAEAQKAEAPAEETSTEKAVSEETSAAESTPEAKEESATKAVEETVSEVTEEKAAEPVASETASEETAAEVEVVPAPAEAQPEVATH
ncbi:MAG TPA: hypothetical protein EYG78_02585 [Sulfurovum sp.]|nr:hypothetical protein [Sulfurovum sp.]